MNRLRPEPTEQPSPILSMHLAPTRTRFARHTVAPIVDVSFPWKKATNAFSHREPVPVRISEKTSEDLVRSLGKEPKLNASRSAEPGSRSAPAAQFFIC
jgi:hypothetical protein